MLKVRNDGAGNILSSLGAYMTLVQLKRLISSPLFVVTLFAAPLISIAECIDSDNGIDSSVSGVVDVTNSESGRLLSYPDNCDSTGRSLTEFSCSSRGKVARNSIECKFGCYGGRCNNKGAEGVKSCYIKFVISEELLSNYQFNYKLKSLSTLTGDYSFQAREYYNTPVDYLLELKDSVGTTLGTYGVLSNSRPPIAEDFTSSGPVSLSKILPDPGIYLTAKITPFDSSITRIRLIDPQNRNVLFESPVDVSKLNCPGCVPAGMAGRYYKKECCPGTTPIYQSNSSGQYFVCSLCPDITCKPAAGSVSTPLDATTVTLVSDTGSTTTSSTVTSTTVKSGPIPVNLIKNGSFESPATSGEIYPTSSTQSLAAWTVADSAGDDWVAVVTNKFGEGSRPPAAEGRQVLAFNTWSWAGHPGGASISQDVATIPGAKYGLTMRISTWKDAKYVPGSMAQLYIKVGSVTSPASIFSKEVSASSDYRRWSIVTCRFVANSETTRISLEDSIPLSLKDKIGLGIDSVTLFAQDSGGTGTCSVEDAPYDSSTINQVSITPTLTPTPKPAPSSSPHY